MRKINILLSLIHSFMVCMIDYVIQVIMIPYFIILNISNLQVVTFNHALYMKLIL